MRDWKDETWKAYFLATVSITVVAAVHNQGTLVRVVVGGIAGLLVAMALEKMYKLGARDKATEIAFGIARKQSGPYDATETGMDVISKFLRGKSPSGY